MKFPETLIRKESIQCQVLWCFNVQYPSIQQLQNSKSSLNAVEWHTHDKQLTLSISFVRSLNDYFFWRERLKKRGRKNNKCLSLRPCLRNETHQTALNVIFPCAFWRIGKDFRGQSPSSRTQFILCEESMHRGNVVLFVQWLQRPLHFRLMHVNLCRWSGYCCWKGTILLDKPYHLTYLLLG